MPVLRPTDSTAPLGVCLVIDRLYPGGTELFLTRLVERLDRRLFAPCLALLSAPPGGSPGRSLAPADTWLAPPAACPTIHLGLRPGLSSLGRAAWRLAGFLRRHRIAVVQVHHPLPTAVGLAAALLARTPGRVHTRFSLGYWMTPRYRRIERLAARLCDVSVANCAAARAALLAEGRPPRGGVTVIPTAIDTQPLSALGLPRGGPPRVGLLANLRPVKDPETFVRAAARVARTWPAARFEIAGEGEMRPQIEALRARLGLEASLALDGALPPAAIPAFLGRLDVAVLCSRSEALPNALLEFMAAGRPIVATAVGGIPETVRDEREALLVPPGDDVALAAAVDRLLADRDLAARLGSASRARCLAEHSMTASVEGFGALWQGLAGRSGRRGHGA